MKLPVADDASLELCRLVTGKGRFLRNLKRGAELHAAFARSSHAHAKLISIDLSEALQIKGVRAIFTGADLAAANVGELPFRAGFTQSNGAPASAPPRNALAQGIVRFVGEPVALVIAATREIAKHASDVIEVSYEALESVVDIRKSVLDSAPSIWPLAARNVVATSCMGNLEATNQAIAKAPHTIKFSFLHPRLAPSPIETRCCFAEPNGPQSLTLHLPIQNPSAVQSELAEHILKIPLSNVRVVVDDIGGSFGLKGYCQPEYAAVSFAALQLQHSVRWEADRMEDQLAGTHGRDQSHDVEIGYDNEGKVLALRIDMLAAVGAYLTPPGLALGLSFTPRVITSVYNIPNAHVAGRAVLTNTAPIGPYRGAGRPEGVFAIETALDLIARRIGISPIQVRLKNLIRSSDMPFTSAVGQLIDSGDFERVLLKCCDEADIQGFDARKRLAIEQGQLLGLGVGMFAEWTGVGQLTETVHLSLKRSGHLEVFMQVQDMGQGLREALRSIAKDRTGLPAECIEIKLGDTKHGSGFGSFASRSAFVGGSALDLALVELEKLVKACAPSIAAAIDEMKDESLDVTATYTAEGASWPNGAHIVEVRIDPNNGFTSVERYTAVDDVGKPLRRSIVHGQIIGGIAQGIGAALFEHMRYDDESGQNLSATLMDYALPRAEDIPKITSFLEESQPCTTNRLGVKGVGESGTVGAAHTVLAAIRDAIGSNEVLDLPVWPEKVWQWIEETRK
jgi:aerobic carbon-monoxide dehydrogenase large subunit